ncbi:MAG: hypothetical protein U0987_05430 [Afipia sp.]|nr:hypothetical protein [Afipia sp.]
MAKLSDQILLVLHEKFFDDAVTYASFSQVREAIKNQPANAVRLELENLVSSYEVVQKTEERVRSNPILGALSNQPGAVYEVKLDGYKLSKAGINAVNKFSDEYFASLQSDIGSTTKEINVVDERTKDESEADWEPIPLNRDDTKLKDAISALDRVAEELRGDNGYATANPEEKAFVRDKLSAVTKRLKEETYISWMYLNEFAIKPLRILIDRFGGAAIGLAAVAAKEAIKDWLKKKGIAFLDDL